MSERKVLATYSNLGAGLDVWGQFAKSIRIAGRGGAKYPPFGQGNSALTAYYTGTGVIACILVLALLFTFFSLIAQCCVLAFFRKSLRAKREKLLTKVIKPSTKLCALFWILIVFVMFSVGAFTSYTGGAIFGSSVTLLGNSAGDILNSSQAVIKRLSPAANNTFDSINLIVGNAIDASPSSINTSRLDDEGVNSNMAVLISDLKNISSYIDLAVNDAASTGATYTQISNKISALSTNVSTMLKTVKEWNNGTGVSISGGSYTTGYTPSDISFSSLNTDFGSLPNGKDQMDPIKSIEMTKTITSYSSTSVGLPARITSFIRSANAPTKGNLSAAVVTAKNSILGAIKSLEEATDGTFDGGRGQLKSFLSSVSTYNDYRSISMIILSSCIFIVMLVVSLGFFRQRPVIVKGCNLCVTPLYLLVQLLAVLIFVLAVVFGDVCSSVFDYTPAPILKGLDSATADPINQLTTLRDECSNNVSIIQVAVDVKLVKSEDVNITLQLDKTISSVNLTSVADFDLSPLVLLNNTPSVIVNPLTNLDLSALQSSSVNPKISAANSDLSTISTALNAISSQLSNMNSSHTNFTYMPDSLGQRSIANDDFSTRAAAVISDISNMINEISSLQTKINNYQSALTGSLLTNASSAKSASSSWGTDADSRYTLVRSSMTNFSNYASKAILNYPPVMRATIHSKTSVTEIQLRQNTTCLDLGTAVFALQDALCGQFEGGLDSLWLAYAWIGIAAAISIPAFIFAANRLLLRNLAVYVEVPEVIAKPFKTVRKSIRRTAPISSDENFLTSHGVVIVNEYGRYTKSNLVAFLFKRDTPKSILEVPITQPPTLLGSWATMIKAFRQSLHPKTPPTSESEVISYYTPVIALAAVIILGAFLLFIGSCAMCVNSCCCKGRLRRKYERMKPPGFRKALCAKLLFGIPPVVILFMIAIHIMASNALTDTLVSFETTTFSFLGDTVGIIHAVSPAIGSLLDDIASNVNSSILMAANSVNFGVFNATVNPPMGRMIAALRQTEDDKQQILRNSAQISATQTEMNGNLSILSNKIDIINGNVTALMSTLYDINSTTFYSVISGQPSPQTVANRALAMQIAAANAPDTNSIFSSLATSANLSVSADNAQTKLSDSIANAQQSIKDSTEGNYILIQGPMHAATQSLHDTKLTVTKQLNDATASLQLNKVSNSLNMVFDQAKQVDRIRIYGQLAFILIYIIPIALISVSGAARRPGYMKAINLVCVPYYLLIYLFGFVILLVTVLYGDEAPGTLAPVIGAQNYAIINTTQFAIDSCLQGKSILEAAASAGAFNIDIVDQANQAFNSVNIGNIGAIDLNGTVASDPTADASNSSTVSLQGMTIQPFTEINGNCTDLLTDLNRMRTQLSAIASTDLNVSTEFSDWLIKLQPVLTEIDSAVSTTYIVGNQSASLSTTVNNTNTTANSMIAVSQTISPLYHESVTQIQYFTGNASANISAAVPNIKTQILADITVDTAKFNQKLNCTGVANDFVGFRQEICGDMVTSLDGFWSTLVVLALMALLSLPTTVFVANTLFLDLTQYQTGSDQDISGTKEEPSVLKQPPVDPKMGKMKFDQPAPNIVKTQEVVSIGSPLNAAEPPAPQGFVTEGVDMGRIQEEDDVISPIMIRSPSQGTIQKPQQTEPLGRQNSVMPGRASFAPNIVLNGRQSFVDVQGDFPRESSAKELPGGHSQQPSFVVGSGNSVTVRNPIPALAVPSPQAGRARAPSVGGGQQAFRQSVARGSVVTPQYENLEILAEKFNMPELREIATRLTVEQVSLMDVMEAEQCGISRDSYFKLKRYFISRRKL